MPIKVVFGDDVYALADTPEEAMSLIKLSKNGAPASHKPIKSEEERVRDFALEINSNAMKFLCTMLAHPTGITGDAFTEKTDIKAEKFGGVLGGASKIAKKHDLDLDQFVFSEMRVGEAGRYRFLGPGVLLTKYSAMFARRAKTSVAP